MSASVPPYSVRLRRWLAAPACLNAHIVEPIRAAGGRATVVITLSGVGRVVCGWTLPFNATHTPSGTVQVRIPVEVGQQVKICVKDVFRRTVILLDIDATADPLPSSRVVQSPSRWPKVERATPAVMGSAVGAFPVIPLASLPSVALQGLAPAATLLFPLRLRTRRFSVT